MNQRRPRGRNNNNNNRGRHQNTRNQTFDSNGPEGRVRGSATQVLERYLAQARDAQAAGDNVLAENFFQHAEHYYRLLSAANAQMEQQQRERQAQFEERDRRNGQRGDNPDGQRGDGSEGQRGDGPDNQRSAEPEGNDERSEGRDAQAQTTVDEEQTSDAPPKKRRRRSADGEGGDVAAENEADGAQGEEGEIDAAFLKAPPKPRRRRRAAAETEAAD